MNGTTNSLECLREKKKIDKTAYIFLSYLHFIDQSREKIENYKEGGDLYLDKQVGGRGGDRQIDR
jgi:hypothetical protein